MHKYMHSNSSIRAKLGLATRKLRLYWINFQYI